MNRTHTTTRTDHRFIVAVVIAAVLLAACGESNDTAQPSGTTATSATDAISASVAEEPEVNEVPEEANEGGFGAPAAAPGEFGDAYPIPITASATVDGRGCWYLTGAGSQSLLVAPEDTVLDSSGAALVIPNGELIADGDLVDAYGWFQPLVDLPGGPDGRWANYVAFCDPAHGDVAVTTSLGAAFDPAAEDPAEYGAELVEAGSALFDTDYGCGYGFTAGDRAGVWALRIDAGRLPVPPAAGQVTLPDDRFVAAVTAGRHLFVNHCDDVVEWFEPDRAPVAVWPIVAGRFAYPDTSDGGCPTSATIVLTGAIVDVDGTNVNLDDIAISNNEFGCFAG